MEGDGFPDGFLDFSEDQRIGLAELGASREQVRQLRIALPFIRSCVAGKAKPNDVKGRLQEIEELATGLSRKLMPVDQGSDQAIAMLDAHFWLDDGESDIGIDEQISRVYLPRLQKLARAAKAIREQVGAAQKGRPRSASPESVRAVDRALRTGWLMEHRFDEVPYPSCLEVSRNESSKFYGIACLCFEAAGGNPNPDRAIRAFLGRDEGQ